MPGNIALSPQLQTTPLHTDFGQSPIGSLGSRSVQQVEAGAPRSLGQVLSAFGDKIKDLGSRLMNALTPSSVRADDKFRRGLEATSSQVGELLGALSKTPGHIVDGMAAKKLIDGLPQTAAPVTSRGVSYDDMLQQRVAVNVQGMTTSQLVALRDGVAMAQNSPMQFDPRAAAHLAVISTTVKQELTQRMLDKAMLDMAPILEKALAEVPREAGTPGAVGYQFDTLFGVASRIIAEHGPTDATPEQRKDLQRALIKETMSNMVDQDKMSMADMGAIIKHLPSSELRKMMDNTATIGTEVPFTLERLVTGAIGLRADQSEAGFMQMAERLLAHKEPTTDDPDGPLHNPQGFAKEVVLAARHLAEMTKHADIHHLHIGEGVDERVAELHAHLEELLRPSNLMLGELSNKQLHEFSQALKSLGIERGSTQIATEITRRKDEATASYNASIGAVRTALAQGDLPALLEAVTTAAAKADEVAMVFQKLGTDLDGADQIMQFKEDLMGRALQSLDTAELGTLFAAMNTPEMRGLVGSLGELGHDLLPNMHNVDGQDPALGKKMFDASIDLQMLGMGIKDALGAKGVSLPRLPDDTEYGPSQLTDSARTAILDTFGVQVTKEGSLNIKIGVGNAEFQRVFGENLDDIGTHPSPEARLPSGEGTGVCSAFWADLPRARYAIRGEDGTTSTLLDREARPGMTELQRQDQQLAAVDKLRDLVGGDESLLMLVSQFPNESSLAGVQKALMSQDSPIRLPDGTPGRLMGVERISYTLGSDGDGGVVVRVDQSIENATHFFDPATGNMTKLDPETSRFRCTYEVTIGKDKSVTVTDPVQYLYEAEPTTWTKDYPKPHNMMDIMNSTDANLRADFRSFMEGRFIAENLDFLEQHAAFKAAPTLDGARALAQRFIGADAPDYINLSSTDSGAIQEALRSPGADQLTGPQLVAVFGTALTQLHTMMDGQPVPQFITLHSQAPT